MNEPLPFILVFAIALMTLSCQKQESGPQFLIGDQELPGSWLLVENGYSPGVGYVVEPVPSSPPQKLRFHSDGTLHATVEGLQGFRYYRIRPDTLNPGSEVLSLYKNDPDRPNGEPSNYSIDYDDGLLKLHFRYCIEGCHMGFRKLKASGSTE